MHLSVRSIQLGGSAMLCINGIAALHISHDGVYRLGVGEDVSRFGLVWEESLGLSRPVVDLAGVIPDGWNGIVADVTDADDLGDGFLKLFPAPGYGAALALVNSDGEIYHSAIILGIRNSGLIELLADFPEEHGFARDLEGRVQLLN